VSDAAWTQTPLDRLQDALEAAGDRWRASLDVEAQAENEYRREHALAWVRASAEGVAITARAKYCENQASVVVAKCNWNMSIAKVKADHSKREECQSRLMAKMADQKYFGKADGGGF
jgi:hypothetical protein